MQRTGIQQLPTELLTDTLTILDVDDLFRVAQVCRRWRFLAFDHPSYWGTIIVDSADHRELCLVEHQLSIAGDRHYYFEINYSETHVGNDPVLARMIPLLRAAIPYAHSLYIRIDSMYRFHVEKVLCLEAPNLKFLSIGYLSDPLPELYLDLPLAKGKQLLSGAAKNLRTVRLRNIILPKITITAFEYAKEVFFDHHETTLQEEFPCYLFDFFPNVTRLRLTGGQCLFTNAPLPGHVLDIIAKLEWLDLEFQHSSLPRFFSHLPIHKIPEVIICSPDEDSVYTALEPLRSYFDLVLTHTFAKEFNISVKCGRSNLVRHFAEPLKYYSHGSADTNALLENELFLAQLASFKIQTTLWSRIHWWLPRFPVLPKLVVEVNEDSYSPVALPAEPLVCPELKTLVLQTVYDFVYVAADDVVAFADRITDQRLTLELRRVLIAGSSDPLSSRFESVQYSLTRY
ncbi:hypothetical protein AURDEDRAFT_167703 [Auricularia subglabra TFB-10046 SS5]|nr:hypothetical protein AURDEDRAFT_167703 [Auricularia subglabra TFB-10046 SS5]